MGGVPGLELLAPGSENTAKWALALFRPSVHRLVELALLLNSHDCERASGLTPGSLTFQKAFDKLRMLKRNWGWPTEPER